MSNKVYLVDGSGYIFRAFYAVAPLTNKEGFPTNALFGYTRMLKKLLNEAESTHVVVVFDAGRRNFRHDLDPQYKANRIECPEELLKQMPYFREISQALGLKILEKPGYEADDLIGTLSHRLGGAGYEVVIVSGDKDLMQLVNPNVSIWDTLKDIKFGAEGVVEKFGVGPEKVVEILALMGDASDNVIGIQGVGPKTATELVKKYGSVETVLENIQQIRDDTTIRGRVKIAEQIELNQDRLRLNKQLVQVKLDSPVVIQTNGDCVQAESLSNSQLYDLLCMHAADEPKLHDLVDRFEFHSLLKDLNLKKKSADSRASGPTIKIIGATEFSLFLEQFNSQRQYAFDVETTSLDVLQAKIVGVSVCWSAEEAYYIPVGHQVGPNQVEITQLLAGLKSSLENPEVKKIGQNLKYDIGVMAGHGVVVAGVAFDCMIASYLLNPDRRQNNLTFLAKTYLNRTVIEFEEIVAKDADFSSVDIETAARYSGEDAYHAWCLRILLNEELKNKDLLRVFNEIEMPLVGLLSKMERAGIGLDCELLQRISVHTEEKLKIIEESIYQTAGSKFNINSPKQLSEILFVKLAIPTKGLKKTKSGTSTDSSVLEQLAMIHPLPALILDYRGLYKLKSTYIDVLPGLVSKITGRLHSSFNQTITATGRLSSSDPNLQNIPVQSEEGLKIREAFVAAPGNILLRADYSQIELRLLAHLSNDENLIEAFLHNEDIHARTARDIFNLGKDDKPTSEQRRVGKTINFGIIYGMGAFRLAKELKISMNVAKRYIEQYFERYPKVNIYFQQLEQNVQKLGYVETLFGRKRFIAGIDTAGRDQGFLIRAALNAPLQGSAADIIKLAMIRVDAALQSKKSTARMILQVHDELLFECPTAYKDKVLELIRVEMESVVELKVPLKIELGCGFNWQEAH